MKNLIQKFIFILAVSASLFSCSDDTQTIAKFPTIVEIATADPANFSILKDALVKTGLDVTLNTPGSYTVFAPTNAAFTTAGISSAYINALTAPADNVAIANLKQILLYHVIGIGTRANDLIANSATGITGYTKTFANTTTTSTLKLSMFVNQVGTDVLINGGATNGGAKVTTADIDASNGVVHVIDNVLGLPTILKLTIANPDYSTLVSIVTSTGGTFGDQTAVKNALAAATATAPLTLNTPNNAAFTSALDLANGGFIPAAPTAAQVTTLLKYHVISGNRLKSFFTEGLVTNTITSPVQTVKSLIAGTGGARLEDKGSITPVIRNISVFKINDIQAVNGVIHTIDKVLQPVL